MKITFFFYKNYLYQRKNCSTTNAASQEEDIGMKILEF